MADREEREYVLGTGDDELDRLAFQHGVWREECLRDWDDAGFERGMHVLDIGCGPGFVTRDLAARLGPQGRVTAVDVSRRFIDYLGAQPRAGAGAPIDPVLCDVTESVEALPGAVDGIYVRWMFCFVRDPRAVAQRLRGLLKPGGAIVIQDYFNWSAIHQQPPCEAWSRFKVAIQDSARVTGGDLDIMSKLPAWLAEDGLTVELMRPYIRIGRPGNDIWRWFRLYLTNFGGRMVQMELWTAEEHAAMEQAMDERERMAASFFVSPPQMSVIARKPTRSA